MSLAIDFVRTIQRMGFCRSGAGRASACVHAVLRGVLCFALLSSVSGVVFASVFTVVNTKNSGGGSLREAIADANANPGPDTIVFNIPTSDSKYDLEGHGEYTIVLNAGLTLSDAGTTLDASTQPGYAGTPLIQLDGSPTLSDDGLTITGGDCTVRGFAINRFTKAGIELSSNGGNLIAGNHIGTDVTGALARGNDDEGIVVTFPGNTIGGVAPADRNLISGNGKAGVLLDADGNVVSGNLIGTAVNATVPLPNGGSGIEIRGSTNTIGGLVAGAANVISGNERDGIEINSGSDNSILGNLIGADPGQSLDLGNGNNGIYVHGSSTGNRIGDATSTARNVISGNDAHGVEIEGSNATGNLVLGNAIGTDATGSVDLGNALDGVRIDKADVNVIGGDAAGAANLIAFNGENGVVVEGGASGVPIRGNSIHSNGALGIDLDDDGVTPNDPGDLDDGSNLLQNHPVLTGAALQGGNTLINATLWSTPNTAFEIDFYSVQTPDPSGHGEGREHVATREVTTDAEGYALIGVVLPPLAIGTRLTTTATDAADNTSEFGETIVVSDAASVADLVLTKDDGQTSYTPGETVSYVLTVTNEGASDVIGATVSDPVTSLLQVNGASWHCSPSGGATCTEGPVAGNVNDTIDLPSGSSVTYTVDLQLHPEASGDLINTAVVTPPAGTVDPDVSNNSATDVDTQGLWVADLAITKDDGLTEYSGGDPLTYTIVVSNTGPSNALVAQVTDVLTSVPQISSATWSCEPTGLATCTEDDVDGDIDDTVYLPVGETLTYTVEVELDPLASGNLRNTAIVAAGPGGSDDDPSNNSATDENEPVSGPVAVVAAPNVESIPAGSLVVAMDNDKQNLDGSPFNIRAYGLVIHLLWDEIPVKWAIRAGKAKDGIDFSASAARIFPSATPTASLDFRGGPFIVPASYAADALSRIAAFGNNVAVYELTADADVDIRYTLNHKPKVATLNDGGNAGIHNDILNAAGLVFGTHYAEIDIATLVQLNASSCFTLASEPHCDDSKCGDAQAEAARAFASSGANFLAQCRATLSYENNRAHGLLLTTNGIVENNLGNDGFLYPHPDQPFSQIHGPLAATGGSVNDFELAPHSGFRNNGHLHVQDDTLTDHYAATAAQLTPGPGSHVFYLGGHEYGDSDLDELNGQRMYLNAVMTPALRPPPCGLNFEPEPVIGGTIREDTDGDGDLAGEPGRPGVEVRLYRDGGDGVPDGNDDVPAASTTTDGSGTYLFETLAPGHRYWVAVDSTTIAPSAGFVGASSQIDVWAEQTYGPPGALCDDGNGGVAARAEGGSCFGGRSSDSSDVGSDLATSEHVAGRLLGLGSRSMDFGFSFAAIVNRLDAAEGSADGNRSIQGSLRQFLQNSNAIVGEQATAFRIPNNPGNFDGSSFRITPVRGLPEILDPALVDGRTQPDFVDRPIIELDGTQAGGPGLSIAAGSSTVRGLVINRFQAGIELDGTGGNRIEGNRIGTDAAGTTALGNSNEGIKIKGDNNQIGGPDPSARNLISGNGKEGIKIDGDGNVVRGNLIGTDSAGTVGLGNLGAGIGVRGANNLIGGGAAGEGNVVSANGKEGILARDGLGIVVAGNRIGTDPAGTIDLGNALSGVFVDRADGAVIGGVAPETGNTIVYNGENGVTVKSASGVSILRNSIHRNDLLGIDLEDDGVTPNDDDDPDDGANGLQNFPVVSSVVVAAGQTTVVGLLNSTPDTPFTLQFFASDVADPGSFGEGQQYMGEALVTTDPAGNAPFTVILPASVTGDEVVTSTATAPDGSTSEFNVAFTFVELTGTVFDDVNGDGNPSDGVGRAAVDLTLYRDGGNGIPDGGDDLFVDTVATGSDGSYAFPGVLPGTYWVVVDSRSVTPSAALRAGFVLADVWAEQTYGTTGAWCDDGAGGTSELTAAAPCFGGRRALVSDDAADLSKAEHVSRVVVGDNAVHGVDFGFSFAPVVNTRDEDDDLSTNRTVQGCLRQFMQNANAIVGPQSSVFRIPTSDPEYDGTGSGEFTVTPEQALPDVVDPVVLDGTTQPGHAGAPLIVIAGNQANGADGLRVLSGGSTIRGFTINAFDDDGIDLTTSNDNHVEGSWIGLKATGLAAQANDGNGIRVEGADNVIGGTAMGQGNVLSGNAAHGILLTGAAANGNLVTGNAIGVSADRAIAVANDLNGVEIAAGAVGNTVGGTVAEARNLISGNSQSGIAVTGVGTSANHIKGNYVGTDASGSAPLPNKIDGIVLADGASGNVVGGSEAGAGNVASGNRENGVHLFGAGTTDNLVQGNHIGVGDTGLLAVPNQEHGVRIDTGATDNTIGGTTDTARNVISANESAGVYLVDVATSGNRVEGNYIGIGADGGIDQGNARHGVWLDGASATVIGGTDAGAGNHIGHNGAHGVYLVDSDDNLIQGNFIGTDPSGTQDLGNAEDGVNLEDADRNAIGGNEPGAGNTIAFNGHTGVSVEKSSVANPIRRNSIFDNVALGIDLKADGTTPNDLADIDSGPNDLQNYPVLASAVIGAGSTTLYGSLQSAPGSSFAIDFFSNGSADPSGHGEGAVYIGTATVTTDASGQASFDVTVPVALAAGDQVTATATGPAGSTSEFSAAVPAVPPNSGPTSCNVFVDQDAWLSEKNPLVNHGDDDLLQALNEPGDGQRPVYRFDLAAIAAPAIVSATAWFYVVDPDESGSNIDVHAITDAWTESGATWSDTGSDFEPSPRGSFVADAVGFVSVDLTALVQSWNDGTLANNGVGLRATSVEVQSRFTSREWPTTTQRPCIEVVPSTEADLSVSKDDGITSYNPGGSITYTITVTNAGPSAIAGAVVSDPVTELLQVTGASWECESSGGATCTTGPVTGDLNDTVDLPVGGMATYTLVADIDASATGDLTNTAQVSLPAGASDPDPLDNSASDTDVVALVADLEITNDDGVTSYVPGTSLSYTIVVTNHGPATVTGVNVTDLVTASPQVSDASWTCSPTGGATCTAGPVVGDLNDIVDLPHGATVTYTLIAELEPDATGDLANTATVGAPAGVTDSDPTNDSATDTDAEGTPSGDLSIAIDDGVTSYTPGGTVTYSLVVGNAGPSTIAGATVVAIPTSLPQVAGATWSCAPADGASCVAGPVDGDLADTVDLPPGSTATYTFVVDLDPAATGNLDLTATVAPPAGADDPDPANNSATDTDTEGTPTADLLITKDDGVLSYLPGGTVSYTIVVSNRGPSAVNGADVTDPVTTLSQVASAIWSCAAGPGASCAVDTTSGGLFDSVDLAPGSQVTYTLDVALDPGASGDLANTATVTPPSGVVDPDPANNAATDTDTEGSGLADLSIGVDDGVTSYVPGETLIYSIVVENAGPSAVAGAVVTAPVTALPQVSGASWSCEVAGGASCAPGTVAGDLNDTVDLPVGGAVTYTLTVDVDPAAVGELANVATVVPPVGTAEVDSANNAATDTDVRGVGIAELEITKDDGVTSYVPGGTLTYTIDVTNSGPSATRGVTVIDAITTRTQVSSASWTCAPAGGAVCTAGPVTGDLNDSVDLPVGGSVRYTLHVQLAPGAMGDLVNTASLSLPGDTTDPTPANTADDTDTQGSGVADLGVVVDDGATSYTPGGTLTYTIVVSNDGPSAASGASVSSVLASLPQVASASWTCSPAGGATCNSGNGDLSDTIDLPVDASATYTVTVDLDPAATGDLTVTALVNAPSGIADPDPGDDSASDTDTQGPSSGDLSITIDDGLSSYTPGGTLTYTVVVLNEGPSAMHSAAVTCPVTALPQVSSASWTCEPAADASCTAGPTTGDLVDTVDLPVGGSATYTLVVEVDPAASGSLETIAQVTAAAPAGDPEGGNNSATDTDVRGTPIADLALTKTVDDATPTVGTNVTFTVTIANSGPSTATGVVALDPLPDGYTYVDDDSALTGTSYFPSSGLWTVGSLAPGLDASLNITARIERSGDYANVAELASSNEPDPDSTPGNGQAEDDRDVSETHPVGEGGTVDISDSVHPGEPFVVLVSDADVNTDPGVAETLEVTVVNDATGESETLTLTETGPDTAVFRATLASVYGDTAGANDDAVLVVRADHTVTAAYRDAFNPTGNPVTATDTGIVVGGVDATLVIAAASEPGQPVAVTVADADENADPGVAESVQVTVVNERTGETETVSLTETGPGTGVFEAMLPTAFDPAPGLDGNGSLNAQSGDALTASYADAMTSTGASGVVTASTVLAIEAVLLAKQATRDEVVVGDVAGYEITVTNTTTAPLTGVTLSDRIPPGFKLVPGSAKAIRAGDDGLIDTSDDVVTVVAATGGRPVELGPLALAPGESLVVRYVLLVGSGAVQGRKSNEVTPRQGDAVVGNTAIAHVEVVADPIFDLTTIIGKVFEDADRNGLQDPGEPGVPAAQVVLDDGTYVVTDRHGRFHFPAVSPGQRMLKLNLFSLPPGSRASTELSKILWVSPGLIARANFGVLLGDYRESIGRKDESGLEVAGRTDEHPVQILGRAEALTTLVNGRQVDFSTSDVRLVTRKLDHRVTITGGDVNAAVRFDLRAESASELLRWKLEILDGQDRTLKTLRGEGAPPAGVAWDGRLDDGRLVEPGRVYQYRLEVETAEGRSASPRRLFGVNRQTLMAVELTGAAFPVGDAQLSQDARRALREASEALQRFPNEPLMIEGHTDASGSEAANLDLSRRRAESAAAFLVKELSFPRERIVLRWFGESAPVASNLDPDGRRLNRRVEVRAEVQEYENTPTRDLALDRPGARVNGRDVDLDGEGRFVVELPANEARVVDVELRDSTGRIAQRQVGMPELSVEAPTGQIVVPYGVPTKGCSVVRPDADGTAALTCELVGRTNADSRVWLDGRSLETAGDGTFRSKVPLRIGRNSLGLLVRNESGYTRGATLVVDVADRNDQDAMFVVTRGIPDLTVSLPPPGMRLRTPTLPLGGQTDPGNRVWVNDEEWDVGPDGSFSGNIQVPPGKSRLVVKVEDPEGRTGSIERELESARHQLFLLAFGEAEFGKLDASGNVENAGIDEDYYADGRVALYLKGRIAGKYLITAAFDSGRQELSELFDDLDGEAAERLLTNLDPTKYYSVYGDESSVHYDVESRGKLYLALESDEIGLLIGNYPLRLDRTELAAYQRTLYGGRLVYRSASTTRYGDPDTDLVVFAADTGIQHVRDELAATGGSVYFLSHRDIVEGSETVTLVVRDRNTGLVLSRQVQRQNIDYTIRYEEGRLLFQRPVSSVAPSGSLFDPDPLSGNRILVEVDYETRKQGFDASASGARASRRFGDHFGIGATYIDDSLDSGNYELTGLDAEVRLGQKTRFLAEYAESDGVNSLSFVSEDGGLSFTGTPTTGVESGTAWKAAVEIDIGEWFGQADRYQVELYHKELESGFFSSGNFLEQGTEKTGAHGSFRISERDSLRVRLDRETPTGGGSAQATDKTLGSAQWTHTRARWSLDAEYFSSEFQAGNTAMQDSAFGIVRLRSRLTAKLGGELEHQQTLSGTDNDQTTLGVDYQPVPWLKLEIKGTDGDRGSSGQAGVVLVRGESEIYLTERVADDQAGRSKATVLGARSPLGESSKVYTEYQLEEREADEKAISLVGIQKQWEPDEGIRLLFSGESAEVDAGSSRTRRSTFGIGFTFSDRTSLTARSRLELGLESGDVRRERLLAVNQADYKLNEDLTLQAVYRYGKTRDRRTDLVESRFEERTVGFAYRPVQHDRFNSLARYSRLVNFRPQGAAADHSTMDVISIETAYQVNPRLEWLGKGAARTHEQQLFDLAPVKSRTVLAVQRLNVKLWNPIHIGAEYRQLLERSLDDQRAGFLGEVGWQLMDQFRLGVGYNFTDFSDDEYSVNDYSVRGWFFRVQGKY